MQNFLIKNLSLSTLYALSNILYLVLYCKIFPPTQIELEKNSMWNFMYFKLYLKDYVSASNIILMHSL